MKRVMFLCNGGDYFVGPYCPMDGWTSKHAPEVLDCVQRVAESGAELSLDALKKVGLSAEAASEIIIVEFGDKTHPFDVLEHRLDENKKSVWSWVGKILKR